MYENSVDNYIYNVVYKKIYIVMNLHPIVKILYSMQSNFYN